MIASMTAFARSEANQPWGTAVVELKSVNQRFLEPSFKLAESVRDLEPALRSRLKKRLNRGKVEVAIKISLDATSSEQLTINQDLTQQLLDASNQIQQLQGSTPPLTSAEILNWPGVIQAQSLDSDAIKATVSDLFNQAVEQLIAHRQSEGAALAGLINTRLQDIITHIENLRTLVPDAITQLHQRVKDKLAALEQPLDEGRLEQELVLLAHKADVAEELDRLIAHIDETKKALTKGGPCGRRLDFLMQEFNREANTLSSKSQSSATTQSAVEIKVLVEQMREQVQNIE